MRPGAKKLFWLLPLGLVAVALATLLALPGFVAAQSHRPAMERFASGLTGRRVHIAGQLSLTLLPRPRLTATHITIDGPDNEVISAKSLALDIYLPALLHGQLAVQTLNLDSPVIAFPWPLPGGPRAVAPPPWLAALHAHLTNATITLGGIAFSQVSADLFTGPGGALSLSGNGKMLGQAVTLSLALGRTGLNGAAPLAVQAHTGPASAAFSGTLNMASAVAGQISLSAPGKLTGSASVAADARRITLTGLNLAAGPRHLSGDASFNLTKPALKANLLGQNLNLDQFTVPDFAANIPAKVTLDASNVTLLGQPLLALNITLSTGAEGMVIQALNVSLPGGGTLAGNGAMAGGGQLSGQLSLTVPDAAALLTAYHLPPLSNWPAAHLTAKLAGTAAQPHLSDLTGTLGADHVTGNLVLKARHVAGALNFDHLALSPLTGWAGQAPPGAFTADLEITAAKAEAGPVKLTQFTADAALGGTLNMRRVSARLYGGLAAGSFTLDAQGRVSAAQGFADLPSAAPLGQFIPAFYAVPPALLNGRLSLLFTARGPADALQSSAVAKLVTRLPDSQQGGKLVDAGDLTVTASPKIDLTTMTASGPLTLQYPEASLLARFYGMDQGLVFPGPGSASLRAKFSVAAKSYGLDDFVGNFGTLNASGQVMVQNGIVTGQIAANNVALPPIPATLQFPTTLPLQGKLALSAQRLGYAGHPLLGPVAGLLNWSGQGASLDVAQAAFGGGNIWGSLGMALSQTAPPAFTAKIQAQGVDAGAFALPIAFPYPITSGKLSGTASLTAGGFSLKSVVATLAGTAMLNAAHGTLRGFNLQNFAGALGKPDAEHRLYRALVSGTTPFTSLNLAAALANGNCTLTSATLSGPAGKVTGTGGIDLYDNAQALRLLFTPAQVNPPVTATLLVLGSWATPKHVAHMEAALHWKAPPPATHAPQGKPKA